MPYKEINASINQNFTILLNKLNINLDDIGDDGKSFRYEIEKYDIILFLKPKFPKEIQNNNDLISKNKNSNKNNINIKDSIKENNKNPLSEEASNENKPEEKNINKKDKYSFENKKSLYNNEKDSEGDENQKKRSQSLQKNDLNFKNSLESHEIKRNNSKDKISNSIEKIKEINENNEEESLKPKGLYNLGLNCYMNSLLQCLYYIKELREYFIENKTKFTDEQPTCKALAEVMDGLKNDEKEYFVPKEFKKLMGSKNSLFLGRKAGDVKDLYFNIIDSLLSEMYNENKTNISCESELDYNNNKKMFEETRKEIDENNIINKLFIGYYFTKYFCSKTKINTYSFQTESFILFELEKIQKHFEKNELSLELCFKYYFKKCSKSSFYCNKCENTHIGKSYDNIYRQPKILVLILDRGHGKTFKGKVEIKKDLDLRNYIDEDECEYSSLYKLICISTHEGKSSPTGHYTARCLTENNKYYYFSDTYFHEINENRLFEDEPYLLFYQQIDINENSNEINKYQNDIKQPIKENDINLAINIKSEKFVDEEINMQNIKGKQNCDKKNDNNSQQNKNLNISNNKKLIANINTQIIDTKKSNINNININDNKSTKNNESKTFKSNKKKNYYKIDNKEIIDTFKKFHKNPNEKYEIDYFISKGFKNPFNWKLTIKGPKDSLYEGGKYIFKLDFSKVFNKLTDNITIQNKFYHLNFGDSSLLFHIDYNENLSFADNLEYLFDFIYNLFINPKCEISSSNYGNQKINKYLYNIKDYKQKVKDSISYMLKK